jgi:ABC-type multidrug transport system fused ATPase/permease subunit
VDEIVVLDHGRVAARRSHAELIRSGGPYQRLREAFR